MSKGHTTKSPWADPALDYLEFEFDSLMNDGDSEVKKELNAFYDHLDRQSDTAMSLEAEQAEADREDKDYANGIKQRKWENVVRATEGNSLQERYGKK